MTMIHPCAREELVPGLKGREGNHAVFSESGSLFGHQPYPSKGSSKGAMTMNNI